MLSLAVEVSARQPDEATRRLECKARVRVRVRGRASLGGKACGQQHRVVCVAVCGVELGRVGKEVERVAAADEPEGLVGGVLLASVQL